MSRSAPALRDDSLLPSLHAVHRTRIRPFQAVLFDLDGVLLDTETLYTVGIQEVVGSFGKTYDWALKRDMMGKSELVGAHLLIERLGLPLHAEEYLARVNPVFERLFHSVEPMPGAVALVEYLLERQVPLAIATSSRSHLFALKSRPHGWLHSIRAVVCGDDAQVKALKPAPDIFLAAAARLQVPPAACLVVEDSPAGVSSALAAGMQVVALPDPALGHDAVAHATTIVSSHDELRNLLSALLEAGELP
ncbi:MAG TPA: HAD-IA family hydrolase [Polyangiaceae bacterium]|nr:HAD-IA family hydrolase [Polyangiaceae bacterium]